jgi:hypothetical protein
VLDAEDLGLSGVRHPLTSRTRKHHDSRMYAGANAGTPVVADRERNAARRSLAAALVATVATLTACAGTVPTRSALPASTPSEAVATAPTASPSIDASLPFSPLVIPLPPGTGTGGGVIAAGTDGVYFLAGGRVTRIAPDGSHVEHVLDTRGYALAIGGGSVWTTVETGVIQWDPESGEQQGRTEMTMTEGIVYAHDAVWVADHRDGTVVRIDPASGTASARITVADAGRAGPQGLGADDEAIYVGAASLGGYRAIDPVTNQVTRTWTAPAGVIACGPVGVVAGRLWSSSCGEAKTMAVIDLATSATTAVQLPGYAGPVAALGDRVWVVSLDDPGGSPALGSRLLGFSPDGERLADERYSFVSDSIVSAFDALWLVNILDSVAYRIPVENLPPA